MLKSIQLWRRQTIKIKVYVRIVEKTNHQTRWGVRIVQEVKIAKKDDRACLDQGIKELVDLGKLYETAQDQVSIGMGLFVESGEAVKKQGRIERGPLIVRASSSLNVEKLDDATTQWPSKMAPPVKKLTDRNGISRLDLRMSESEESVCGESRLKDKKVNINVHGNAGKNVGPFVAI
ncbi:hypothetical protein Tco_1275339 [Tanacetum coccineum]